MHAQVGDHIKVRGHHVGEHDRECEVVEVHGTEGGPPYVVRWSGTEHTSVFFPGTDATIERTVKDTGSI